MLYTISDLHLSTNSDKPMDIFSGWENHAEKIKTNWLNIVKDDDIVVIPGDISWAMNLEEALSDFKFIDVLPGKKIIGKGNHDYWWTSVSKMKKFLSENDINSIDFLFNNSFTYENISICGTRGWMMEENEPHDELLVKREEGRLIRSLEDAKTEEKIVFLHYPPIWGDNVFGKFVDIMLKHNVKKCYYGHIHGPSIAFAPNGNFYGIDFKIVSADAIKFNIDLIC